MARSRATTREPAAPPAAARLVRISGTRLIECGGCGALLIYPTPVAPHTGTGTGTGGRPEQELEMLQRTLEEVRVGVGEGGARV